VDIMRDSTKTDAEGEASDVIDAVYPGFQEPLRIAHNWVTRSREWVPAAIRVLEHLRVEYPHALQVRAELVLAYLEVGARHKAEAELELLERTFPFDQDEEALCRFGRLHRELGDDWVKGATPTDEQFRMAAREYETAWNYYDRAFKIRRGHYPGINRASLYFLRGWAARTTDVRDTFVVQSGEAARDLLERRDHWPRDNPEDDIWHLASAAEARLLLGGWAQSIEDYRLAGSHKLAGEFHRECLGKEVRRLLRPLSEGGKMPENVVIALVSLFPAPDTPATKA
jgi:tetratricopeptide (TPR) repeat protein